MPHLAPAGTPVTLTDIVAGLGAGGASAHRDLARLLATHAGRPSAWLVSSGRAAMKLAFEAMKRAAPLRREILVPGYTCYSVPAAVERAGLALRLVDIDPDTLSPDPEQLRRIDLERVLCVVSANLFGIPNRLADLESFAAGGRAYLLDDAAQSLGAAWDGRPAGGFGDVGLYSFDKGKNITTLQGGALVARGRLAKELATLAQALPAPSGTIAYSIKLAIYSVLLRPALYGITRVLPLGLGRTPYETEYPIAHFSPALAGLGLRQAVRLGEINAARIANAARLHAALEGLRGLILPTVPAQAAPVYARFPLRVADPARRDAFVSALEADGIGATRSYPEALVDVPEVAARLPADNPPQPGARLVARTIVTLPTHAYCPPDLGARVRRIAESVLA